MCHQNVIVRLHAVKSLFLPFAGINCSLLLHPAAAVQARAGDVLTFSAQMGLNAWDICYSRLHFLLQGGWACVILCRICMFFFLPGYTHPLHRTFFCYLSLMSVCLNVSFCFFIYIFFCECEFLPPPCCLKWFGLTLLTSQTRSVYLRNRRLTEGAFNLKGCTKEEWQQGGWVLVKANRDSCLILVV